MHPPAPVPPRRDEDARLVRAARAGDIGSFNQLIARWEKRLYNYLWRMTRSADDALDLMQETFLLAFRQLGRLQEPARFAGWLFRIAHNQAQSQFRRASLAQRHAAAASETTETAISLGEGLQLDELELRVEVERALAGLEPEQREVVVLKVVEGFKFEEIAEILDCPLSTVKSRVYAGFEQLRRRLAPSKSGQAGRSVAPGSTSR